RVPGASRVSLRQSPACPWRPFSPRRAGVLRPASFLPPRADVRLDELERLDVEQALRLADDVGLAQRLEELLGAVEVPHADPHRPEALWDVAVRPGAAGDPVLARELDRLLVEGL